MSNHYQTLGVKANATQEEIKKAYRKLAAQHHPDRGGDTKKFQEIQAAYDVLSDPTKKQQYDNPNSQFEEFRTYGGMPPGFEDLMSQMFNGGGFTDLFGKRPNSYKNKTLNFQTTISLEDAFYGKIITTNLNLPRGDVQTLEVKIPAGIKNGNVIRLAGVGDNSIPNAPRGDIHITINISNHSVFTRENDDLRMSVEIDCFDAILGKTLKFNSIDGKVLETAIPPGIQPGQMLNIQGYGMPNISNPLARGRLLLEINITIPKTLTDEQKDQLKKIIS
jgi:curved DNA-binding protein